ncbi:MAG: ferredoxin family protein [Thermodesulfobacteriota bacterium]
MALGHEIEIERCKGCGLCLAACPKNVLVFSDRVNSKGYFPVRQARPEECIFCGLCYTTCPDVAITLTELTGESRRPQGREDPDGQSLVER